MGHEAQAWSSPAKSPAVPAAGVHLPFTAPLLAGTRGRLRGRTIDFILPNPSGGRGAYVAVWSSVRDLAGPTVHDTVLSRRLQCLPSLDPGAVRALSRAVAAEGHAGRAAATAASRAQAATDAEALRLWAVLLMALIRGSAIPAREHAAVLASLGSAGPGKVTDGFTVLSQRLGWNAAQLADGLRQVSAAFVPIGRQGRMRRLLSLLGGLHDALVAEHRQRLGTASLPPAALLRTITSIAHCLHRANGLLDAATLALEEPAALIERWRLDPILAPAAPAALEELLDGWDRICLLWHDAATPSACIDILPEIALLVRLAAENNPAAASDPVVRMAATSAAPDRPDVAATAGDRHPASGAGAAREVPAAAAAVQRNERIRALELALDDGNG